MFFLLLGLEYFFAMGRRSARFRRLLEQFLDGVIAACDPEIGLALEGVANVMRLAGVAVMFDDGQDEFIGLIQCGKDLVLGDR